MQDLVTPVSVLAVFHAFYKEHIPASLEVATGAKGSYDITLSVYTNYADDPNVATDRAYDILCDEFHELRWRLMGSELGYYAYVDRLNLAIKVYTRKLRV